MNKKFISLIIVSAMFVGFMKAQSEMDLSSQVEKLQKDVAQLIEKGKENSKKINELLSKIKGEQPSQEYRDSDQSDLDSDYDYDLREDEDIE